MRQRDAVRGSAPSLTCWSRPAESRTTPAMPLFSFHLARVPVFTSLGALVGPPRTANVAGLRHMECLTEMALGAAIVSPGRCQPRQLAVFAEWEDAAALDHFLVAHPLGKRLAAGWHVRLDYLRRWGTVAPFDGLPLEAGAVDDDAPVVAFTLARMRLPQVPRFIRWGRPVEALVRDHPGASLSLAAIRLPRTVATFSLWRTQRDMVDMVRGHGAVPQPERHATAMVARDRKDFHFEFSTLRFRPLSEHGTWRGRRFLPEALP